MFSMQIYSSIDGSAQSKFRWQESSTWTILATKDVYKLRSAQFQYAVTAGGALTYEAKRISSQDVETVKAMFPRPKEVSRCRLMHTR